MRIEIKLTNSWDLDIAGDVIYVDRDHEYLILTAYGPTEPESSPLGTRQMTDRLRIPHTNIVYTRNFV
jgi:hypothetical protein